MRFFSSEWGLDIWDFEGFSESIYLKFEYNKNMNTPIGENWIKSNTRVQYKQMVINQIKLYFIVKCVCLLFVIFLNNFFCLFDFSYWFYLIFWRLNEFFCAFLRIFCLRTQLELKTHRSVTKFSFPGFPFQLQFHYNYQNEFL